MTLEGRNIVLGVTGSIASYKAADLASKLTQAGALVDVIMTRSATEFVTPLTFSSLTHRAVVRDLFDADSETSVEHVMLAKRAEAVIIAPATANVIAKIVHGLADDMLTATVLATAAPLVVAPAMDGNMFDNPATQKNLETLRERGADIVGPHTGYLASGLSGVGRLADTAEIIGVIRAALGRNGDLAGRRIVVTAGGTQEPIDPVRVITNRSSGKMGFALAEAARDRGADVTLIAAPLGPDTAGGRCVRPGGHRKRDGCRRRRRRRRRGTPSSWPRPSPTSRAPPPPTARSRRLARPSPSTWRRPPTSSPRRTPPAYVSASPPKAPTSS